ncbi:MAG: sigma-54-dependent Fis family transcriptional regulator [Polyangiales bacterium]
MSASAARVVVASDALSEREHKLSLLLDLGATLGREVDLDALLGAIGNRVASALRAERATVFLVDAETGALRSRVADLPELQEIRLDPGQGVAGHVAATGEVVNLGDVAADPRHFSGVDRATGFTTRNLLAVPIRDGERSIRGVMQVLNKRAGVFTREDEDFLQALAGQVALTLERTTLRPGVDSPRGVPVRGVLTHVVGTSAPMRKVAEQVSRAAATDATVLLRGETGTGKGLFARAVHANSRRRDGPFVTVDCTTLPDALVESELFGHERGAFTGADRATVGRVEAAHGGTLFLDEVGELTPPTQAKLLRVLQDRAFERVGGRVTITVDVRVVAATHRDLDALVAAGRFRQDLLYRLRVVEVLIPPLRVRGRDEVASLAEHFLDGFRRRYERPALRFAPSAVSALAAHPWPGNVRELEHAVERANVLAPADLILPEHLGLAPARVAVAAADGVVIPHDLTLDEATRRYVDATIARCEGNLSEAARRLAVGRNTLKRRRGG